MTYEISNGPIPPNPKAAKFPLRQLAVGQSFVAPASDERALRRAAANYNLAYKPRKISVRLVVEGVWCGRIA